MECFVSCTKPLRVGTEQGPNSEMIRTEAHSYDVTSDNADMADKSIAAVFNHQCHLVRENKDIIKADQCSVVSRTQISV